ncbi:MAG: alpha/beta fold hydrolase [Polyangiaceae bacterium]|nr:alpha/beta fold hydrolase [Polyangiaceae bacterium]
MLMDPASIARPKAAGNGRSQSFPFPTLRLNTIDGDMAYFDHGEGPPVVFVHGLVGDFTHFEHVAVRLAARGHRVIGVDLPGCGISHKRRDRHDLGSYARDVLTLLDELGIARASLVGHSAGGAIVTEAALRAPSRVSRVGLLSTAGMRRYPRATKLAARALINRWILERTLERLAMPLLDFVFVEKNAYTEKFVRDALDRPVDATSTEMARVMADLVPDLIPASVLDRAPSLKMPMLMLWGDADKLVPMESVEWLASRMPHATFKLMPACGHMPMIERPERTARELAAFLEPELAAHAVRSSSPPSSTRRPRALVAA